MAAEPSYDIVAPIFDVHRTLPDRTAELIRMALLNAMDRSPSPRLLDLGAGTGRIGHVFVASGDDYVGIDLSFGMLREFARRAPACNAAPRLVHADGERLPFANASFDAVMMVQVLGAARHWRPLVSEALRVLRAPGTLVLGHTVMPAGGLDARMKQRLAALLADLSVPSHHRDPRNEVISWLSGVSTSSCVVADKWEATRTPAAFLARQPSGAQFARLPQRIKDEALARLRDWASMTFGSIEAEFRERHAFELNVFKFQQAVECCHAQADRYAQADR
jgi:ubiquinone/menaquinone biosynthesis C-methylase UbiE